MLDERMPAQVIRDGDATSTDADDLARYASPEMLRHMVLDFRQMRNFLAEPLVMGRAEGVWYWDVQGRRYLDGISGIFTVNVGHANPRVTAALHRQIDQICFAPPLHATNVPAVELANLVASITPGDLNTVKLLSGGSEATEAAIKLARHQLPAHVPPALDRHVLAVDCAEHVQRLWHVPDAPAHDGAAERDARRRARRGMDGRRRLTLCTPAPLVTRARSAKDAPATPALTAVATAAAPAIATPVLCVARQASATRSTSRSSGCAEVAIPTGAIRMAPPLVSPRRSASPRGKPR